MTYARSRRFPLRNAHLWHICIDTSPFNNLERHLKFSWATQSQTVASWLRRGKEVLLLLLLLLLVVAPQPPMTKLIMTMMTYLSYYSFCAQGRASRRRIPSDDEFISAGDEMSCQDQGYVWHVICVLWSTVSDQTRDRPGWLAVNLPALLAQDFPPLMPRLCLHSVPPVPLPVLLHQSHSAREPPTGGQTFGCSLSPE